MHAHGGCFEPTRTIEAVYPVGFRHVLHAHLGTWLGRVDEFSIAHVNAYVAESSFHRVEEDEVARLEISRVNLRRRGRLLLCAAGQHHSNRLFCNCADKTAAIEPGFHRIATPAVGHTEKTDGVRNQFCCAADSVLTHLLDLDDEPLIGKKPVKVIAGGCRC